MGVRICSRCVMDDTVPGIIYDADGVCEYCRRFENETRKRWFPNKEGTRRLKKILSRVKLEGKNQEYNCILGLSGGVDSSYLALKVKEMGLRPLVVHVDAGWNTEVAVFNIEKIVKYCGYDLHTHVVDWEEMRDLQLAYLRAGVANQDVLQDHVYFASLYHFAIKNRIRYILSGGNIATEGIFPKNWHGSAMDAINLKAIHREYGEKPLKTYSTISFFEYYIWYPFVKKMRTIRPLNYMPYNKSAAVEELERTTGWSSYGRKHGESIFTKLFQNYYLPVRFGYDKRRPHLSSLIVSGQCTRESALEQLQEPLYDPQELDIDINYFCKKMRITRSQFEGFVNAPIVDYTRFPNWDRRHRVLKKAQSLYENVMKKKINTYS